MRIHFTLLFVFVAARLVAQNELLPYREIPPYPPSYTAASVAARMVDGLGFRYYWATDGLREEDLLFQPNKDGRTSLQTLQHIYGLTNVIVNAVNKVPNVRGANKTPASFKELRKSTLENIKVASDRLKSASDEELAEFKMTFKNGDQVTTYPFWNEINGPIADAIWHVGQVVSFRRGSGNPFNGKADVLQGKLNE